MYRALYQIVNQLVSSPSIEYTLLFYDSYCSFGSQVFLNTTSGKVQSCSLDAPPGNCTMTQIGKPHPSTRDKIEDIRRSRSIYLLIGFNLLLLLI